MSRPTRQANVRASGGNTGWVMKWLETIVILPCKVIMVISPYLKRLFEQLLKYQRSSVHSLTCHLIVYITALCSVNYHVLKHYKSSEISFHTKDVHYCVFQKSGFLTISEWGSIVHRNDIDIFYIWHHFFVLNMKDNGVLRTFVNYLKIVILLPIDY